jgi:hypothetical protein
MMAVVMDHHCLRIDMRLKGSEVVAQRGQLERAARSGRRRRGLGEGDSAPKQMSGGGKGGARQQCQAFASVHDNIPVKSGGFGQSDAPGKRGGRQNRTRCIKYSCIAT